ncbi:MAG: BatA domain-containing protein, partial [Ilumatobacteraceae bacterium]
MTLLRPAMLWLLLAVAVLVVLYVVLQRRRRHYAVRFTNVELLQSVAPRRPGWRRHLPAGLVALALVASVIGLARPVHSEQVARRSAIIMLAMDVSASMAATDVKPSRLAASITGAAEFVKG